MVEYGLKEDPDLQAQSCLYSILYILYILYILCIFYILLQADDYHLDKPGGILSHFIPLHSFPISSREHPALRDVCTSAINELALLINISLKLVGYARDE